MFAVSRQCPGTGNMLSTVRVMFAGRRGVGSVDGLGPLGLG